jgi:hypothetical protein
VYDSSKKLTNYQTDRPHLKTHVEAKRAVFAFIEGFYNPRRRHSSLGYVSPADYERAYESRALPPDAHNPAAVLGPVKARPGNAAQVAAKPCRPTLTAPARDGVVATWAGTKEWAPQGPNKRMEAREQTRSQQPRYPDP